ncbi:VOC family protein [Variovorax sp. LT1R20]|uniref:VOC family protein n=1 Tax=Variovorax sp. LT1R20 TaxID=3443729 RepID=UPI003F45B7C9
MLHHVEIYVSNLAVTRAFWSELLAQIGYTVTADFGDGFTLSVAEDAYLTFVQVADKHASHEYHRSGVGLNHLAFKVSSRERVDALRQLCLERRYQCLYDERYPFSNGGTDYYALYVEDPDRIKVEFVAA